MQYQTSPAIRYMAKVPPTRVCQSSYCNMDHRAGSAALTSPSTLVWNSPPSNSLPSLPSQYRQSTTPLSAPEADGWSNMGRTSADRYAHYAAVTSTSQASHFQRQAATASARGSFDWDVPPAQARTIIPSALSAVPGYAHRYLGDADIPPTAHGPEAWATHQTSPPVFRTVNWHGRTPEARSFDAAAMHVMHPRVAEVDDGGGGTNGDGMKGESSTCWRLRSPASSSEHVQQQDPSPQTPWVFWMRDESSSEEAVSPRTIPIHGPNPQRNTTLSNHGFPIRGLSGSPATYAAERNGIGRQEDTCQCDNYSDQPSPAELSVCHCDDDSSPASATSDRNTQPATAEDGPMGFYDEDDTSSHARPSQSALVQEVQAICLAATQRYLQKHLHNWHARVCEKHHTGHAAATGNGPQRNARPRSRYMPYRHYPSRLAPYGRGRECLRSALPVRQGGPTTDLLGTPLPGGLPRACCPSTRSCHQMTAEDADADSDIDFETDFGVESAPSSSARPLRMTSTGPDDGIISHMCPKPRHFCCCCRCGGGPSTLPSLRCTDSLLGNASAICTLWWEAARRERAYELGVEGRVLGAMGSLMADAEAVAGRTNGDWDGVADVVRAGKAVCELLDDEDGWVDMEEVEGWGPGRCGPWR